MKLLLIDDELDILDILKEQIEEFHFDLEIFQAGTVEEATNLIDSCDIILSDINMPLKNELEVLLKNCNKPVARITGHDDFVGDMVVLKPFMIEDLKKVILKLMEKKNAV